MESAIMKMAKANHSNMKNLTSLIRFRAPLGSARPRMSREPIEKIMVRMMPRMPRAVFIVVFVTTLSTNSAYADREAAENPAKRSAMYAMVSVAGMANSRKKKDRSRYPYTLLRVLQHHP